MPGPLSLTRMRSASSIENSIWPPPAYRNALRAISETAVAIRVCSCASKPSETRNLARALACGNYVSFVP